MNDSGQTNIIQLENVDKFFGEFQALKNISLSVKKGERIVVCGPSGSGKSTLIRCINRLEEHSNGKIVVNGHELTSAVKDIDAVRKEVGMVFQSFNLFPHLTVINNLMLAPKLARKASKADAYDIAMKFLERVKIPEQADKYPSQLSGGQQQRVAIARAPARTSRRMIRRRVGWPSFSRHRAAWSRSMPCLLGHGTGIVNDISRTIEILSPRKRRGGHRGRDRPAATACGERPGAGADPGQGGEKVLGGPASRLIFSGLRAEAALAFT